MGVSESPPFLCESIDIRCFVSHQATGEMTDVGLPDIITPDDQNIGFLSTISRSRRREQHRHDEMLESEDVESTQQRRRIHRA